MKGLDAFDEALNRRNLRLLEAVDEVANVGGMMLVAATMNQFQGSHARGAGHTGGATPNIVSGDLRRSVRADPLVHVRPGVATVSVAPHMAYGRRVELGFTGVDALGRHFAQPAYPYFKPGVDSMLEKFRDQVSGIIRKHL